MPVVAADRSKQCLRYSNNLGRSINTSIYDHELCSRYNEIFIYPYDSLYETKQKEAEVCAQQIWNQEAKLHGVRLFSL